MGKTTPLIGALLLARASLALAQPPEQTPPPPAPEPNWAPPLPAEPPPKPETTNPPPPGGPVPAAAPPSETNEPLPPPEPGTMMEIYGFAMLDIGFDFGKIGDPNWQDVLRPTKLPAFNDQYGKGPRTFAGVRQSRFGVKTATPTSEGEIKTTFEFELFGVGVDQGQTTFRLRHSYGEWRGLRAGQTWSPFMDPDVFPDSIEYWGPPGMVFFRNVQLAYQFYKTDESDFTLALERPGASADSSSLGDRFDLTNVVPRFPAPDVSGDLKLGDKRWGYVRLAGIFRYIKWDDLNPTPVIQGHAFGWGFNASANIKLPPALLKLQVSYGSAIENYMNDAGADVAPKVDPTIPGAIDGVGLPVLGIVAFVDIRWFDYLSSTVGYSLVNIQNSDGQLPDAFHRGQYALGNALIHPTESLMFGPEVQFGRRLNNNDGFSANDYRIQFSVKYNFSKKVGGHK